MENDYKEAYFKLLEKFQTYREELLNEELIRIKAMAKRERDFHDNLLKRMGLNV